MKDEMKDEMRIEHGMGPAMLIPLYQALLCGSGSHVVTQAAPKIRSHMASHAPHTPPPSFQKNAETKMMM